MGHPNHFRLLLRAFRKLWRLARRTLSGGGAGVDPASHWLFNSVIPAQLRDALAEELRADPGEADTTDLSQWFHDYRPDPPLLETFRSRHWPAYAPVFTIILRPGNTPEEWRRDSLRSVAEQTYPHWELLCPETADLAGAGLETARGDYVCWLDVGDALEPQALHRFAEAVLEHGPDLLYSDAVRTGPDLDEVLAVEAHPQFSYERYLTHAYFSHLTAVRTALLRRARPMNRMGDALILRVLEQAGVVGHVPDLLYRQRCPSPDSDRAERVREHLQRVGCTAEVAATGHPACVDVRYALQGKPHVAVIIPTKNRVELLRRCIETVEATTVPGLASLHVVDHESDDPATRSYLDGLRGRHPVIPYQGHFNFSRINNHAVRQAGACTHYLFLNNDIEALRPGWLEHMLGLGQRPDVGVVGALLLYPDRRVQHAGLRLGMYFGAGHVEHLEPVYGPDGSRLPGRDCSLIATRELSAVTGACLLISAPLFHALGGFDDRFAVGFGDIDLCLRARARGFKVVLDAQAVLLHHESATRGKGTTDPHPHDTQLFRTRYLEPILAGDPFFSPFLTRTGSRGLNPSARSREHVSARVVPVVLPWLDGRKEWAAAA